MNDGIIHAIEEVPVAGAGTGHEEIDQHLAELGVPIPKPVYVDLTGITEPYEALTTKMSDLTKVVASTGNPKDTIGDTKVDLSLIPPSSLIHEASAFADGANKYGPYNWRENAVRARVYVAAAMRHLNQYLDREDYDPISSVHHLGHAKACMSIILDASEVGNLIDDRPLAGGVGKVIRDYDPVKKLSAR